MNETYYGVHTKRGASEDDPKTLRVDYKVGWNQYKSEWVCFEHNGFARAKAVAWWRQCSPDPIPDTAERAVEIASGGGLAVVCRSPSAASAAIPTNGSSMSFGHCPNRCH